MKSYKRILGTIAKNHSIDSDELLLTLWDYGRPKGRFAYLNGAGNIIKGRDMTIVQDIIQLKKRNGEPDIKSVETIAPKLIIREYDFSIVGRIVEPILYLSRDEVLRIHEELVADFMDQKDPIYPAGIKNEHLFESAIFHSRTSYVGEIKYPTIESAAAALMYSLSLNHAFHNGNKRTAMVAMLVFLDRHKIGLICNENELFKISVQVADHKLVEKEYLHSDAEIYALAHWIHSHARVMVKGERSVTLKKLKQILSSFDCYIQDNGKVTRKVSTRSILGFMRRRQLVSKKAIVNAISDGDEVDKGLIKSIREDLELDHTHSIDSDTFYSRSAFTSSEFINRYKNLLRRLSKI